MASEGDGGDGTRLGDGDGRPEGGRRGDGTGHACGDGAGTSRTSSSGSRWRRRSLNPAPDAEAVTAQWRRTRGPLVERLRFGSLLLDLEPEVDSSPIVRMNRAGTRAVIVARNPGLKSWLRRHCREAGYATAMRHKALARKLQVACGLYDSYKQKRRDPGLLEQVDYRTFEMRVYPHGDFIRQHFAPIACGERIALHKPPRRPNPGIRPRAMQVTLGGFAWTDCLRLRPDGVPVYSEVSFPMPGDGDRNTGRPPWKKTSAPSWKNSVRCCRPTEATSSSSR